MNIRIDLNEPGIYKKVTGDPFGKFVSQNWKRLIDPYTPRDTGALMGIIGQSVDILPFKIHYKEPYAEYVYENDDVTFQRNNPYSTDHWDIKAAQSGQLDKLYRTINSALQQGRI